MISELIPCSIQTEHVLLWSQLDEIEVFIFLGAFLPGSGQGFGEPTRYVSSCSVQADSVLNTHTSPDLLSHSRIVKQVVSSSIYSLLAISQD